MECHDAENFKYEVSLASLLDDKFPYKYSKFNKFTFDNIQMVLDRETDGVKVIDGTYQNRTTKLKFICSCGAEFEANISQFTSDGKRYCNFCSKSKRYDNNNYFEIAKEKCESNNCTLLNNHINRVNDIVSYICKKHSHKGVQYKNYYSFINNKFICHYCADESAGEKHRISKNDIIALVESKDFTYVGHEYGKWGNRSSSKVKIHYICNKHKDKGVQYIDLNNLKHIKKGCPYCCGRGRTKEDLQKEIDDLNSCIDIIEYIDYTEMTVKCRKCGNIWQTKGVILTAGHKCPRCNHSNYEKAIENILIKNNIEYISQYRISDCKDKLPLPFDFFLPHHNILIEVDGEGHYKPIKYGGISDEKAQHHYDIVKFHDNIKTNFCKDQNIPLIRIPYYLFNDKSVDLSNFLLSKL